MIESLNKEIEEINSNLSILPTDTKKNIERYEEYLNECISKYEPLLEENINEINSRKDELIAKFNSESFELDDDSIDYDELKLSDIRCSSNEKMNLNYLLYNLNNSTNNSLDEINKILLEIIQKFSDVGIILTEKDFTHSEAVNLYIKTLLTSSDDIQNVFNEVFFKTPDLLDQITLNIWYLYYKNSSKIDAYYKKKYADFDFHNHIAFYRNGIKNNEYKKHNSIKYIYDLFMNKTIDIYEYTDENKMKDLKSSILSDETNDRNYENLNKYMKSLIEYKGYKTYQFIIDDFKELFTHKDEYKDLFDNKYKEIVKEEKNLFALNKKINKTGLFKLNKTKLANAKLERNKVFSNLNNLYKELNELSIKDTIKNHCTLETNYYDVLKLTTYNFDYFINLLVKNEIELSKKVIDDNVLELQRFIYDRNVDVIDNVVLSEEKDISKMISDMYKLNGIVVDEEKLNNDQVDKIIEGVNKLIIYFDILNLEIDLSEIRYIIDATKQLTNK